jgi:hypothetical protein
MALKLVEWKEEASIMLVGIIDLLSKSGTDCIFLLSQQDSPFV